MVAVMTYEYNHYLFIPVPAKAEVTGAGTHLKSWTTLPTVTRGNSFLSSSLMMARWRGEVVRPRWVNTD